MAGRYRRRKSGSHIAVVTAILVVVAVGVLFGIWYAFFRDPGPAAPPPKEPVENGGEENGENQEAQQQELVQQTLALADRLAAQYDYDAAIAKVKELPDYAEEEQLTAAIARYETAKGKLEPYDVTKVSHIFFHSLVNDPEKVFDGDAQEAGYNQVMTTVKEFEAILQQMYERGYVLVSVHDMAQMVQQEDGTMKMTAGEILLPPGKTPFVMSQDDLSYYEYMKPDGFPSRLVVDENGKITNELEKDDGTVVRGSFDVVPLLDDFVEEHPDFSYRGRKGIIALTGYNGILGYRTSDRVYGPGGKGDWENPNLEADKQKAKAVAEAMRADGWEFASHSWGHLNYGSLDMTRFKRDADLWRTEVSPLVGDPDVIIFPFGSDVGSWKGYSGEKYEYLKSQGFNYFCNVDGSKTYWVQLTDDYLRQGRMNIDGYRMYQDLYNGKNHLEPFIDVEKVFDPVRPLPVPDM